jgi:hypothetical protein
VELLFQEMLEIQQSGKTLTFDENLDLLEKYKEMDKEQKISDFTDGYLYRGEQLRPWLIDKWYEETYGGGEQ